MDPASQPAADNEQVLIITRTFDAPRLLVWKMFSDPYHLAQWWGPKGFTNPVCEIDLRPGGTWHNVMRGPDGAEYPVDSIFVEVVPPEPIVYRNAAASAASFGENPPPSFVRIITFEEADGRTTLTMRAEFDSAADKERTVRRGFAQGTNQSLDKLAERLKSASIPARSKEETR